MTHTVRPIASPDIARQPTFACSSNSALRRLHLVGGRFARVAVTTSASALLFYQIHPRGLPDRPGRRQPTVASPPFLLSRAPCSPVSPARGAAPLLLHPARAVREARASADASAGCLACAIVTLPGGHSLPRAEMSRYLRVVCSWSVMARLTLPRGGASRAGDGGAERGGRAANCRDRRASRRAVPRRRREPSCARLGAAPPTELALASAMRRDAARASSVVQRARVRVRASVAARRIRSTRDGQAHAFSWCSLVLNVVVWP
jgi:hypothetical protein